MAEVYFEDLPPEAGLMLAILYENRAGLEWDRLNKLMDEAIAEFGSIEAAAAGVRARATKNVAGLQ